MKRLMGIVFACLATIGSAQANLITYKVEGLIIDLSSIGGSSDTPLVATFTVSSDALDQDPYSKRGFFDQNQLAFTLGGDVLSTSNAAVVAINQDTTDQYTVISNWGGFNASGNLLGEYYSWATIILELYDTDGTMYLSDPSSSTLTSSQLNSIDMALAIIDLPIQSGLRTTGNIRISQVPEPTSLALLVLGLLGLATTHHRTKTH